MNDMEKVMNLFTLDRMVGKDVVATWGDLKRLLGQIYELKKGARGKIWEDYSYSEYFYIVRAEVADVQLFECRKGLFKVMQVFRRK